MFTWYTLTISLGLFTFGFLFIVYIIENTIYLGRGYKAFIDNDTTKFYLVILVVTGVSLGIKLIINIVQF